MKLDIYFGPNATGKTLKAINLSTKIKDNVLLSVDHKNDEHSEQTQLDFTGGEIIIKQNTEPIDNLSNDIENIKNKITEWIGKLSAEDKLLLEELINNPEKSW